METYSEKLKEEVRHRIASMSENRGANEAYIDMCMGQAYDHLIVILASVALGDFDRSLALTSKDSE